MKELREKYCLCLFQKIVYGLAPHSLIRELPPKVGDKPGTALRNNDHFARIRSHTVSYLNFFVPHTVNLWNALNAEIKSISDPQQLKRTISMKIER